MSGWTHKKCGAPGRIRTVDLVLRRHTLYPSELRAQLEISLSAMIVLRSVVGSQWKGKGENRKLRLVRDLTNANSRRASRAVLGLVVAAAEFADNGAYEGFGVAEQH